jgi:hypothetical protein
MNQIYALFHAWEIHPPEYIEANVRTFSFQAASPWNQLPGDIRKSEPTVSVQVQIKDTLISESI